MLLKQFGTVRAIREAPAEELLKVPGMTRSAVQQLKDSLG
jgi:excinuclease UvrABC nuclease subunit